MRAATTRGDVRVTLRGRHAAASGVCPAPQGMVCRDAVMVVLMPFT
jgi:hypothetical protein